MEFARNSPEFSFTVTDAFLSNSLMATERPIMLRTPGSQDQFAVNDPARVPPEYVPSVYRPSVSVPVEVPPK